LQHEEDYLRLVIDTIPTMAWSLRPDGAIDFVNQRWMDYTGLSLEQVVADPAGTIHPEDRPRVMEKWQTTMAAGEAFEDEMRLRRADGAYRWFLVRTVALRNEKGAIVKWYGTSTDVDDRHALTRRLVELQESERKDLARELHDRIGPTLTSLSINLKLIKDALSPALRQALDGTLADSGRMIHEASAAMRDVMSELRPEELDNFGLQPALARYAEQFAARARIAVSVRTGAAYERAAPEVEIALFRIAQEALNNVAKHARAKSVVITLECQASEHVMSVADDGIGFRASGKRVDRPHAALGLVTMRERAQAVGSRLSIEAPPGGGTRLTVRVPR
jgi:two-component system, NarL family, sensor histidine kinase UhpB